MRYGCWCRRSIIIIIDEETGPSFPFRFTYFVKGWCPATRHYPTYSHQITCYLDNFSMLTATIPIDKEY